MAEMMGCPICDGEGTIDCNTCDGGGDMLHECQCGDLHLAPCYCCRGTGLESCGTCSGRGRCPKSDTQREHEGQANFLADDDLPF